MTTTKNGWFVSFNLNITTTIWRGKISFVSTLKLKIEQWALIYCDGAGNNQQNTPFLQVILCWRYSNKRLQGCLCDVCPFFLTKLLHVLQLGWLLLCPTIFKSNPSCFFVGLRSGLWLDHSRTFLQFLLKQVECCVSTGCSHCPAGRWTSTPVSNL